MRAEKRSVIVLSTLTALMLLFSGCAVGNQYTFRDEQIGLPLPRQGDAVPIATGVEEARPYVLSGSKGPEFVGLQRGGFGNPFNVTNASGRPLAEDVSDILAQMLERSGYPSRSEGVYPSMHAFVEELKAQGVEKGVYIEMVDWKTDIYARVTLHYNLHLYVVDSGGEVLAQSVQEGVEAIGGGGFEKGNSELASRQLSIKLSYLFTDPEVAAALKD